MRLDGRRESTNVDDRRGRTVATAGGLGLGGVIIVGLIYMLMGGSLGDAIKVAGSMSQGQGAATTQEYTPSEEEQELATFAKRILAGTEDVWTKIFAQYGKTYVPPKLVLFTGAVQSGCGGATSSSGPFYCSADQRVYLDLSFFMNMKKQIGADGDFAYAYVIAHEVGQTTSPASGPTTTTGSSAPWRKATSTKAWPWPPRSATTISRSRPTATASRIPSTTAPPSSVPAGSRRASRPATSIRETPSPSGTKHYNQ